MTWLVWLFPLFQATSAHAVAPHLASQAASQEETITLAAGCFWGVEEFFRKLPGVKQTRVGYAGGHAQAPTYEQVSSGSTGHAESVEVRFDPAKTSLRELLTLFFKMHDPTTANRQGNDEGTQYRSAIFYRGEAQKKAVDEVMHRVESSHAWKAPLTTQVAPLEAFYPAEESHQRYLIKHPGGYDNHYLRKLSFDR
jgi:methionine-S-sulfoxide reductase